MLKAVWSVSWEVFPLPPHLQTHFSTSVHSKQNAFLLSKANLHVKFYFGRELCSRKIHIFKGEKAGYLCESAFFFLALSSLRK